MMHERTSAADPDYEGVDLAIFRHLDAIGYAGFVGCEYRPAAGTIAGLGWMRGF